MLRRLATGLITAVAALAALLVFLEGSFRLLGYGDDAMAMPHPWVGWVHIPGRTFETRSEDPALGRRVRLATNALGLRDVERRPEKAPGTYRVLVLGDSYVEAAQVPFDSMLTRHLEGRLASDRAARAAAGDTAVPERVEVWNCGVAGYSTAQELLYLQHVASEFHPDLVVLCFLPNNDVADHVPEMASSLRNRPFFRLEGDSLRLDRGQLRPDRGPVAWLRLNSRVFGWVTTQIRVVRTNLRQRAESRPGEAGIPHWLQLYVEQPDSIWTRAWDLTERLIVATRDEARRQGAGFVLVCLTSGLQVHPQARASWPRWSVWEQQAVLSLDAPERRLERLASAHDLDFLPLLPALRAEAERTGQPLHIGWTGHWNAAGHAAAARALAARIEARWEAGGGTGDNAAARR